MNRLSSLVFAFAGLAIAASAQDSSTETYKYMNGHWFDGEKFLSRIYYSVGGTLHPNPPIFRVEKTFDLDGGYVIPACGEAHNHNAVKSNPTALKEYASDGILYVENPSNLPDERTPGDTLNGPAGPDVLFSNGGITAPGGHPIGLVKRNIERGVMTDSQGEGAFYFTVSSLKQLDEKLRRCSRRSQTSSRYSSCTARTLRSARMMKSTSAGRDWTRPSSSQSCEKLMPRDYA